MRRRDFMKGLGAFGVTLGFGSRVVSKDVERVESVKALPPPNDWRSEVTVDRQFKQEYQCEPFVPKGPTLKDLIYHDWSKELEGRLNLDAELRVCPAGTKYVNTYEPNQYTVRRRESWESVSPHVRVVPHELERLYVAFIIEDQYLETNPNDLRTLFFDPAMKTFADFINQQTGENLFVAPLLVLSEWSWMGILGSLSEGGRIPIRTTCSYDIGAGGHQVAMEFMAKVA